MKNGLFIRLFILLLIVLLAFGGCTAKSKENKGSSEEGQIEELTEYSTAKATIGVAAYQKLIGYYRLPLADMFDTDSIEKILTSEYVLNIYYLVEQYGRIVGSYVCEEGEISRISGYPPEAEMIPVLLNEVLPEQLPDNAEVLDIYFLDGESSHHGTALYLRTNKGDFVYYNYFLTSQVLGKQQTFFTESEFFDLMRAVNKAEREAWGYTDGPNWLPIVIGAGVAVVAVGGVVWFLLHRKKKKAMTNAIVFFLLCSMLIFVPSCSDKYEYVETKENCYLNGLQLYEIKELYDAAGEGEQSFDEKIVELKVKSVCTRDEFLTAYNHFKDQVIVVPNSDRFEQSEFVFEYAGTSVYFMDAPTQTTSVDMVRQTLHRPKHSYYGDCMFYSAASMDPIYEEPYQEMIRSGYLVDARPITPEDMIQYINKEGFRIEAYVEPYEMIYGEYATYVSPVYYLFVYQEDTYVGHFQIICYAEEPPYFYWADFEHLDLMTLEEAIQSAQPPASEK